MNLVFAIALALLGTANAANFRLAAAKTGVTAADATVVATFEDVSLLEESSKKGVIKDAMRLLNVNLTPSQETTCVKPTTVPGLLGQVTTLPIGIKFSLFF